MESKIFDNLVDTAVGAIAHAKSGNGGAERHPSSANGVTLFARDDTSHRGTVIVGGIARSRVTVAIARVMINIRVVVGVEVRMAVLHAIVDDSNDDPIAGVIVPDFGNIDVDARRSTGLPSVE